MTKDNNKSNKNNPNMQINIAGVKWKNPITTASGTFHSKESLELYDYTKLGAVTTKGVSDVPWRGNATPRIAEASSGMLNSVGLENPGVEAYLNDELEFLHNTVKEKDCRIITNVAGHSKEEYLRAVEMLNPSDKIDMLEINISCPNLEKGGMSFGTDSSTAAELIKSIKSITNKPLIVKLTPNVTDICEIALAVEDAGADAVSLINTLAGMSINAKTKTPVLANIKGGLSGPAVKPVALRMVYDVSRAVNIPVVGMGGISCGTDAAEFIMAGASAIAIGTAALVEPGAPIRILNELKEFMIEHEYSSVESLKI